MKRFLPLLIILLHNFNLSCQKVSVEISNSETPNYKLDKIEILDVSGYSIQSSGNDFIGLIRNYYGTQSFQLKFIFPDEIIPLSIQPDPSESRNYASPVHFTIKFSEDITQVYTVKISSYNSSEFKRKIVRGVWVSDIASDVFDSKDKIKECVRICHEIGINTIFPVVYNDAKTKYPSAVMKEYLDTEIDPKYSGRDPLAELIEAAKEFDIQVVAWFEYGFASVYNDQSGGLMLKKYPHWASRDKEGNITQKNNFYWLDAFNPEVQQFIKKLVLEVMELYPDLAGVQGDDRLPALPSNGGYNMEVIKQYQEETGKSLPKEDLDSHWLQWRADKLSDFGEYIYNHVKAINPKIMVSWSPSPYDWSLQNYLQDWPEWLERNIVDFIHPQLYRYTFEAYKIALDQNWDYMNPFLEKELIFSPGVLIGIGSGDLITPEILENILAYNRSKGIMGETYFYYERIKSNPGFQEVIKRFNQ